MKYLQQGLGALFTLIGHMGPTFKAVLGAASIMLAFGTYLNSVWAALVVKMGAVGAVTIPGTSGNLNALALLNYVFPLDVLCNLTTSYLVLFAACTAVRMTKAFVPTIA